MCPDAVNDALVINLSGTAKPLTTRDENMTALPLPCPVHSASTMQRRAKATRLCVIFFRKRFDFPDFKQVDAVCRIKFSPPPFLLELVRWR
jgi:hypothetical protein